MRKCRECCRVLKPNLLRGKDLVPVHSDMSKANQAMEVYLEAIRRLSRIVGRSMKCIMCQDIAEVCCSWKVSSGMVHNNLCGACAASAWNKISAVPKFKYQDGECVGQEKIGFNGTEAHLTFTIEQL